MSSGTAANLVTMCWCLILSWLINAATFTRYYPGWIVDYSTMWICAISASVIGCWVVSYVVARQIR